MRWPIFAVLGLVAEALSVSNHLVNGFGGASGSYALRTEGDCVIVGYFGNMVAQDNSSLLLALLVSCLKWLTICEGS